MTLLHACKWLGTSWLGATIRASKWDFAVIEMVHLLALALLGGALLVTGLRIFGLVLTERRADVITRDLQWLLLASFAIMIITGVLLFSDGPLRYYANPAFRLKLLLIAGAAVTGLMTDLLARRGPAGRAATHSLKAMAGLSLTLWLSAAIAGRVIGVL